MEWAVKVGEGIPEEANNSSLSYGYNKLFRNQISRCIQNSLMAANDCNNVDKLRISSNLVLPSLKTKNL